MSYIWLWLNIGNTLGYQWTDKRLVLCRSLNYPVVSMLWTV